MYDIKKEIEDLRKQTALNEKTVKRKELLAYFDILEKKINNLEKRLDLILEDDKLNSDSVTNFNLRLNQFRDRLDYFHLILSQYFKEFK